MDRFNLGKGVVAACFLALALAVGACGGDDGSDQAAGGEAASTDSGEELAISVFQPFTGELAFIGPNLMSGCLAGVAAVNEAGGVLGGQELTCEPVDSGGSNASAVPAANQMLINVSNLVGVIGPALTAPAVTPVISDSEIVMIADAPDPRYNENEDPYFFRIIPSDSTSGRVMGHWAYEEAGYATAAAVFADDENGQISGPPTREGYQEFGGELVADIVVEPRRDSYRTEAAEIAQENPEALLTEMDPQTAATFFGQLAELMDELPPIISHGSALQEEYRTAVGSAVGVENYDVTTVTAEGGAENEAFSTWEEKLGEISSSEVEDPMSHLEDAFAISGYDSVILMAMSMEAADSSTPSEWRSAMLEVTGREDSGKRPFETYEDGLEALENGNGIRYVGAGGEIAFNEYQNALKSFEALRWNEQRGEFESVTSISAAEVEEIQTRFLED